METINEEKKVRKTKQDEFVDTPKGGNVADDLAKAILNQINQSIMNLGGAGSKVDPKNAPAIALEIEKKANKIREDQAKFAEKIIKDKENLVFLSIPTIYKQFQPSFTVSINGCTIKVPCDGKTYKIHKVYANEIYRRLRHIDEKVQSMRANNNIQEINSII
jgi:hypothetical protein